MFNFKKEEPKKNIDAFGNEVFVGDTVAFALEVYFFGSPYATMKIGEISSIEDNCARVKFVNSDKDTCFVSVNIKNLVKNTNNCKL